MRCFVGIGLDTNVAHLARRVQDAITDRDPGWRDEKWVDPENLHVTVRFLGELEPESVDSLSVLFDDVAGGTAPFELHCEGLGVRRSGRRANLLWLGLADKDGGFSTLVAHVDAACARLGIDFDARHQNPHVTLCRTRRAHPLGLEAAHAADALIRSTGVIVSVRSYSLFVSRLAPRGPQYRIAGTWCLRGEFLGPTGQSSP